MSRFSYKSDARELYLTEQKSSLRTCIVIGVRSEEVKQILSRLRLSISRYRIYENCPFWFIPRGFPREPYILWHDQSYDRDGLEHSDPIYGCNTERQSCTKDFWLQIFFFNGGHNINSFLAYHLVQHCWIWNKIRHLTKFHLL